MKGGFTRIFHLEGLGFGNKGFKSKARVLDYWLGISSRNTKMVNISGDLYGQPTSMKISGLGIWSHKKMQPCTTKNSIIKTYHLCNLQIFKNYLSPREKHLCLCTYWKKRKQLKQKTKLICTKILASFKRKA